MFHSFNGVNHSQLQRLHIIELTQLQPRTHTMRHQISAVIILVPLLLAILIGFASFSEAYVGENKHLVVWDTDAEFQMDSNAHQMLLQAEKSGGVGYGALNPIRPACLKSCEQRGQPYTGRPCSKVYRCNNR
jgi:hypothetical protein